MPSVGTVPSALTGLTALFGKGRGVSPSPESPDLDFVFPIFLLFIFLLIKKREAGKKKAEVVLGIIYQMFRGRKKIVKPHGILVLLG